MGIASANEVFPLQSTLGQDIQLGRLYDVRNSQFFGGISLRKGSDVNDVQQTDDQKVQNAEYRFTYSLDKAETIYSKPSTQHRGLFSSGSQNSSAEGSVKYMNE